MNDYTHILVAIDFSSSATEVLKKAQDIASRNNAKLSLLHIVEYLPPIDTIYEPMIASSWSIDENEMLNKAKQTLENYSLQFNLENASLHTSSGIPKHEISQFVEKHQCDLVVIGSHGRHGINILLGSTANAVLHRMPCDVLAVKIRDKNKR